MAAAIRADAAAWDVVHFQRWLQPQASAPGALGPQARRPAAACGRRPPGACPPLEPPPTPPNPWQPIHGSLITYSHARAVPFNDNSLQSAKG